MSSHNLIEISDPPPDFDPSEYPTIAVHFFGIDPSSISEGVDETETLNIDEAP